MMLEPLDTGSVALYLDFISNSEGRVLIEDPKGFDATTFITEAATDRYARESSFSRKDLIILSHNNKEAFDLLLNYRKWYNINAEVNFIISAYSVDYIIGSLDFQSNKTDQISEFSCQIIQEVNLRKTNLRLKTKIDLFSNRNLDLETITPATTSNVLIKAKPVIQISEWSIDSPVLITTRNFVGNASQYFNGMNSIKKSEIKNTLSWIVDKTVQPEDHVLINAVNDLTDVFIEFININILNTGTGTPSMSLRYRLGLDFNSSTENQIFGAGLDFIDYNHTMTLTGIPKDYKLWIYFVDDTTSSVTIVSFQTGTIKITSTATGIDSIVKAVRLNDAQKQVIKSINGNTVSAPLFESSGEHYGNFIYNGRMGRGFENDTFTISLEQISNQLGEICGDYRTIGNTTFFGEYSDFYKNEEGASFLIAPNEYFSISVNEYYALNKFELEFDKYEKDKDEQNTINAIHTKTQWNIPNPFADGDISVKLELTRDPFKQRYVQEKNSSTDPTTALSEDTELFITDTVDLPAGTSRDITSFMTHNVDDDGNVQILNDSSFNWGTLGFDLSDSFTIDEGGNLGNYTVLEYDFNIIKLTPVGHTPNFTGKVYTKVSYIITNTSLTNRTDEGFDQIVGLENGDNFSNLRYTPKRIIQSYEPLLSTAMQYLPNGTINNTEFINGGNVTTQYDGGAELTENADVLKVNISSAILSMDFISTSVQSTWQEYNTARDAVLNGKFLRISDNLGGVRKVYPRKMEFIWRDNIINIEAEVRLESEFIEINEVNGLIQINEPYYDRKTVGNIEWSADTGMFIIYDIKFVPMINETRYDYIKVNDTSYETPEALAAALNELLND